MPQLIGQGVKFLSAITVYCISYVEYKCISMYVEYITNILKFYWKFYYLKDFKLRDQLNSEVALTTHDTWLHDTWRRQFGKELSQMTWEGRFGIRMLCNYGRLAQTLEVLCAKYPEAVNPIQPVHQKSTSFNRQLSRFQSQLTRCKLV